MTVSVPARDSLPAAALDESVGTGLAGRGGAGLTPGADRLPVAGPSGLATPNSVAPLVLPGGGGILLLCDHASAAVPDGIALGVAPAVMGQHVAIDIGAEPLTRALSDALGAPAVLARISRLVIDLHREPDHPALIPLESDGVAVPGNAGVDRFDRIARFHAPYHAAIARQVARRRPRLIVAIHSFTRRLMAGGHPPRTLEAGILYNRDDRAGRVLLSELRAAGIETGDNAPYSGRVLNATLNRHGEGRGIASVSIEVRNDLIADAAGVARWCALLAPIIAEADERVGGRQ